MERAFEPEGEWLVDSTKLAEKPLFSRKLQALEAEINAHLPEGPAKKSALLQLEMVSLQIRAAAAQL